MISINSLIYNNVEFRQTLVNKNYYVSSTGDVYSKYSNRIIKCQINKERGKEYKRVDIYVKGKQKHFKVHRLVYEAWVRPLNDDEQVNHYDDNSLNNDINNLYAGSQKKNNIHDCIKNENRVGNVNVLTVYDRKTKTEKTFCPASEFIEYSGHTSKSGSLTKVFKCNWFKERYDILEYKSVNNLNEYKSVTTMGDECNPVG